MRGVDARDSDATPGQAVTATSSKDSGGNLNWIFDATWAEWLGTISTDFHTAGNWSSGIVPDSKSRVRVESANPMVINWPATVLDLTVGGGLGKAVVTAYAALTVTEDITILTNGTLALNKPSLIRGGLCVMGGGTLTHSGPQTAETNKIDLKVYGNVAVEVNATVNVTGKGYAAGYGPGYGTSGDYGGRGSDGYSGGIPSGPCYGSFIAPTNLGTGGNA